MRKNDWLLLLALLAVGGALFLLLRPSGGGAQVACVYHADECVATLPLSAPDTFVWQEGEADVRIEVSGGAARVAASSCPDGLCVRRGALSRAGESAVCLPNRVSVVIQGAQQPALDAVVY